MSCEDEFFCKKCKTKLVKQLSSTFIIGASMKPTMADRKETEHRKKVKDFDRAVRMRKKAFGRDAVGDPVEKPDPRHVIRKGRTLGGQQVEVDKKEFIKAAARDPAMVKIAQESLKKNKRKAT